MIRRNFLQHAGLLSAAFLLRPSFLTGRPSRKIGIQLYTLRDLIGKDVSGVLAKVAKAGYKEVEVYGFSRKDKFWGLEPRAFKQILRSHQLTSPSGHYDPGMFLAPGGKEDDLKVNIEAGAALGHSYLTVPYLDDRFRRSADDYKAIGAKFNRAGELCKQSGLRFAYHNHSFEFDRLGDTSGYDILLKETDPALVKFELDLYWAVRAGKDPVAMFKEHPGRFAMWHVKDMDRQKPDLNTEIGDGSIDFRKIFAAAKISGVKHILVEQENFAIDPYQSIARSYQYINTKLLSEI
ncbi:sugar phosphate isomerase/epimerase family protein [Pararcticibacter amylolyticus]|uniref:Sugar phosphate isomerase/epimerase n=1 Tax=Pararcticibacter amylolyticus TaxID=2173175 RepID=A0A2U2PBY5_9SPHI|nr:sugar phosphate isomerase/epimerase [Pararcticibacter amylolyticus]PWG78629.1 sugar phosphate isomerase/epimerase [Pararcticibacter amylolyticus]